MKAQQHKLPCMPISITEYNRQVAEWIRERWPATTPCPLCRVTAGWELLPIGEIPLRTDIEGSLPGKAVPVVPLVCKHCAYIVCLNAIAVGAVAGDPAPVAGNAG